MCILTQTFWFHPQKLWFQPKHVGLKLKCLLIRNILHLTVFIHKVFHRATSGLNYDSFHSVGSILFDFLVVFPGIPTKFPGGN